MKKGFKTQEISIICADKNKGGSNMKKVNVEGVFQATLKSRILNMPEANIRFMMYREYYKIHDHFLLLDCATGGLAIDYYNGAENIDFEKEGVELFLELLDDSATFIRNYITSQINTALGFDTKYYKADIISLGQTAEDFWKYMLRRALLDSDYGIHNFEEFPVKIISALIDTLRNGSADNLECLKVRISDAITKFNAKQRKLIQARE